MATLKNPNIFKGILQYKSTDNFTKETGYMYLIRGFNENGEETGKTEIYFGNRKYGEANVSQTGGLDSILEEINKLAQETANSKPVTYSELKSLRDNGNLIPGQKYRIIDYITTVNKPNISSAGHPFNIIVEALNENTLSEQAKAMQDENDGYFDSENLSAWQLWYCLDNDESRFEWAIPTLYDSSSCVINSNLINGNAFKTPFAFSGYMWNDPINGNEYESKVVNDLIYEWGFEEEPNGSKSLYLLKSDVDIYNEEGTVDTNDKFYYRGVIEADGIEYDYWQKCEVDGNGYLLGDGGTHFALTERIVEGNIIEFKNGKGVIYRMIDEYGNDCPYDFKNIMFKRPNVEDNNYYFTFSWVQDDAIIIDTSIFGNNGYLLDDAAEIPGVFSNVIGKYIENGVNKLPVNIFISDYNFDNGWYYGCSNNILGDKCYSNTFGNDCYNNTFGNSCESNSFGNVCNNNTFGNYYSDNSFGNDCYNNEFGNYCQSNTFGDNCHGNSFGKGCSTNTLGNDCYNNSFSDNCIENTFGNECYNNSFGNECYNNSFGYNCFRNSFDNICSDNTFDDYCKNNTLGNHCHNNSFGNDCYNNTFGNYCHDNSFGNSCESNSFGNVCNNNTFGKDCESNTLKGKCELNIFGDSCVGNILGYACGADGTNTFGNNAYMNIFGADCNFNKIGENCNNNIFGVNCWTNTLNNHCNNNIFGNDCLGNTFIEDFYFYNNLSEGCSYNSIRGQSSSDRPIQNLFITKGVSGTYDEDNEILISDSLLGANYEIKVAKNSSGELKIYCEADLIA